MAKPALPIEIVLGLVGSRMNAMMGATARMRAVMAGLRTIANMGAVVHQLASAEVAAAYQMGRRAKAGVNVVASARTVMALTGAKVGLTATKRTHTSASRIQAWEILEAKITAAVVMV